MKLILKSGRIFGSMIAETSIADRDFLLLWYPGGSWFSLTPDLFRRGVHLYFMCLHAGIITHVNFLKLMYLATVVKIFKKVWMRNRIVLVVSYWIILLSTSYRLPIHTQIWLSCLWSLLYLLILKEIFTCEKRGHMFRHVSFKGHRVTIPSLTYATLIPQPKRLPRSSLLEALVGRATWVIFMGSVVTVVFDGIKWTWKHVTRIVKRRVAINLHIECTGTWQK